MNAPHDEIDKIRSLLDSYYDGVISPEDFNVLVNYFKSVDCLALPVDMRDDAELIMLTSSVEDGILASSPEGLEEKIRAVTVDKIDRPKPWIIRWLAKPVAAAAVVALVFMTVLLKPVRSTDFMDDQTPILSVKFAIQVDEEPMMEPIILAEDVEPAITPVKEKSTSVIAQMTESKNEETDNYIEITNIDQASILAQDALALVRRKLAVAGYSIGSASVGLRHIDETMRDVIVN
ncbi:MAG: hypothetical protein K2J10_01085 [Muribaculaceae bacterium]|nr:hypothetical protein [Muribaculaceae bacterium]